MTWAGLVGTMDLGLLDAFGVPTTYDSSTGPAVSVTGIFDSDYVVAGDEPGVSTSGPAVFYRLSDLPVDPEEDADPRITIDDVEYRLREVKKDGQGGVLLLLHET